MPHANIWIRKENWETWQTLPDKSDFVNSLLGENNSIASQPVVKADIPDSPKIRKEFSSDVLPMAPQPYCDAQVGGMECGMLVERWGYQCENHDPTGITRQPKESFMRTGFMITEEIKKLEAEVAEADSFNQDPDYAEVMKSKAIKIQELWAEWHQVTGR